MEQIMYLQIHKFSMLRRVFKYIMNEKKRFLSLVLDETHTILDEFFWRGPYLQSLAVNSKVMGREKVLKKALRSVIYLHYT